jgi:hypothetical protein
LLAARVMTTPSDLVQDYLNHNYRLVFWPHVGDAKGWTEKSYTLADYHEGYRVGILTGTEVAPGQWLHDVDIDWAQGSLIAQTLLPPTGFVFGRPSKRVSHCFYVLAEALASYRYEDIDKTCLIELRGTKNNGDIGLQTMAPPSVWTKGTLREPLAFVRHDAPSFIESATFFKQRVCLSAISMLFAKHFGTNGFGHDVRLAWAGFLLRAGIGVEDLITMGEAISRETNNREVIDVRRSVESTAASLAIDGKKVKGGPALARLIGKSGKTVLARVNEWLGRDSDFIRDQQGRIIPKHQGNIKRAIELLGHDVSYNEFSDKPLLDNKPLEDREVNRVLLRIESDHHFQPPQQYFEMVLMDLAWSSSFHPVKDYLATLTWDKTPRIDTWLITAAKAEDSLYTRAISSIMLIAAVRRIRQPGCKYDEMVVWESEQGAEKSSAAQALCPDPAWFSDDLPLNLDSKQIIEKTLGKWIIECAELSGKRKAEIESLKSTMSRQVDGPARMAYAHFAVERPRHFILIGTTNSEAYLNDPTGARRFWPVAVKRFNLDWIRKYRDQLWAEACVREAAGESIRLHENLWPDAAVQQERRREIDPWEDILRSAMLQIAPSSDGKRRVATTILWDLLGIQVDRRDRSGALRISDIMQRLGFKRTTVRVDGEEAQAGYITERHELLLTPHESDNTQSGNLYEVLGHLQVDSKDDIPI